MRSYPLEPTFTQLHIQQLLPYPHPPKDHELCPQHSQSKMHFRKAELPLTAKWRGWQILSSKINYETAQIDRKKKIPCPGSHPKACNHQRSIYAWKLLNPRYTQWESTAFWPRAAPTPLSQLERLRDSARQGRSWEPPAAMPQVKGNHAAWNSGWWPCPVALFMEISVLEIV